MHGVRQQERMELGAAYSRRAMTGRACRAGGSFIFWVADWFALMNDKMGGDLDKIKVLLTRAAQRGC